MNPLWPLAEHPVADTVGWILLHSLWQGALVGVVFGSVRFGLRRGSANARYLAGCLALGITVIAPLITVSSGTPTSSRFSISSFDASVPALGSTTFSMDLLPSSFGAGHVSSLIQPASGLLAQLAPALAPIWLLGVVICSLRLTRGCWWVRKIRVQGCQVFEAEWMDKLNDLRLRLGISQPVRLLQSSLVEVPTMIGWLRPVILLPAASISGLTPAQLESVLAHELAHIRRLDYLVNAVQCAVETLLFYHPVVWWISRCIREERENCCDDMVLEVCDDRLDYARALASLEQSRPQLPKMAFAATGGSLLNRIRRLLGNADATSGSTTSRHVCGLALLGIGLLCISLGMVLFIYPAEYRGMVRLKLDNKRSAPPGLTPYDAYTVDPYVLQTQSELLQSRRVLEKVIEKLDLNKRWAERFANGKELKTPETLSLLKRKIHVRNIRNTSLFEISVSSDDQNEAVQIANAIADSYTAYLQSERQRPRQSGIAVLLDREKEKEQEVEQQQQEVDALREKFNIPDAGALSEASMPLSAESLRRIEADRVQSQVEYIKQATLLESLKKLGQEKSLQELAEALPTALQDPLLAGLLEQLNLVEQRVQVLSQEYGPQHSEFIKAQAQVLDLQRKVQERVKGILAGLEARVASLLKGTQELEKEIAKARDNDFRQVSEARPYFEAKRRLEELKEFKRILQMKIAAENIDFALPAQPVEIVDETIVSPSDIFSNRSRGTSLILLGLVLDAVGLALLKEKRQIPPKLCPA